ncbi:MAG: T9SS type A sorting domain-containing protein [Saprospiraceae bacterium]
MTRHLMLAFLFVFAGLLGPAAASGQCFTPADITVSGFGCFGPNGTYTPNGELNGAPSWGMTNPVGSFSIVWSSADDRWEIRGLFGSNRSEARGDNYTVWAANATGDITNLPCGGWTDPLDVGCIGNDGVTLDGGCGSLTLPTPTAYMVEGGGEVCAGQGASILLEHSDAGVYYQLKREGTYVGDKVEGIDNTLDLGSYTEEGIYTVVATPGLNCTDETEMGSVEVTVLPAVVPTVSIASSDFDNAIATGTNVTFTATPTGGGATPRYQWKKNGTNVGTNSNTYADNTLVDGDVISCVMESNDPCATPVISTSNDITMTVEPYCLAFCNGSTEQFLYDPVVNEYLSTSGIELYKVDVVTPIVWYIRKDYEYFYTYESNANTPPTGPYYISPGGSNPPCPVFVTLSAGACPTCVAPSVTCPSGPIVAANSICQATLADYTGMATPMDGCGDVALSQSPNTGTTLNHGSNTVVITATDDNGNTGTCFFTVVVADQTPPNLECPANTTVEANSNCMGTVGDHTVFGGSTRSAATTKHTPGALGRTPGGDGSLFDNCDGTPTVVQSPSSGTVLSGHNDSETVTLTASDAAGNTSTCSFTVTLKDVTPPSITCPANTTVAANSSCGGTVGDHTVFGGDGRSAPDTKQGMANVPGTLERTPGNGSLSDNCSLPTVVQSPSSGTVLSGHNDFETVTLTATDAAGNTSTCSFTVTLKDVTPPNLTCPANTTVAADGNCSSTVGNRTALGGSDRSAPTTKQGMTIATPPPSGGGSLFDNCDGTPTVTQSPASGTVLSGHNDIETVTLTATDDAGNTSTCSFTVTLKDVTPPTPICKTAHLVLDANGNASLAAAALNDGSSDNCTAPGGLSLAVSPNVFDCDDAGNASATLTVTDAVGNTASCTATVAVLDVLYYSQQAQRMASDGLAGDEFGWGLGLSGQWLIAGAPNDKVGTQNKQGSAYVFGQNQGGTDNWGQLKQIRASDGAAVDYFGNAASVDGTTALVGAHGDNVNNGGNVTDAGSAYIYEKDLGGTNNWGQRKRVSASDATAYAYFGNAVSLASGRALVGAAKHKEGTVTAQGAAYIFEKDNGGTDNWGQAQKLTAADGAANNFFGQSVAQSGDLALVGASGNSNNRGAVYVFDGGAAWAQAQKLTASDAAVGDGFGTSLSMSSGYALVGAPNKATYAGAAYVFKNNGGTWAELKKLAPTAPVPAVNDRFGTSVALAGDYAYVSAVRSNGNTGAVYVFHKDAGGTDNWGQIGYKTATGGASGDQFGYSLAVSDERMALGANLDDVASKADQGSVYVFKGEDCPDMGGKPESIVPSQSRGLAVSPAVQCWPNPFRDELTVEIGTSGISNLASEIVVMDATGRLAMRVELPAGQTRHTLNTATLKVGLYFVQVSSEAGVRVVPVTLVR